MAPVQLWLSVKPNHKEWCKAFTGILCFIKDYKRRSFFFRLFSLLVSTFLYLSIITFLFTTEKLILLEKENLIYCLKKVLLKIRRYFKI